jgi:hypothetical protein
MITCEVQSHPEQKANRCYYRNEPECRPDFSGKNAAYHKPAQETLKHEKRNSDKEPDNFVHGDSPIESVNLSGARVIHLS